MVTGRLREAGDLTCGRLWLRAVGDGHFGSQDGEGNVILHNIKVPADDRARLLYEQHHLMNLGTKHAPGTKECYFSRQLNNEFVMDVYEP